MIFPDIRKILYRDSLLLKLIVGIPSLEIIRKDIRIGDIVKVERAGDVIPHVLSVDLKKNSHLGFSYNHISNASLGDKNPGANSYMFNYFKNF